MIYSFDPKTRRLIPTGKLSPFDVSAKFNVQSGRIEMTSIWIDESGLKWDLRVGQTSWELIPVEWPSDLRAVYVVAIGQRSSPIVADSLKEAIEQFSIQLDQEGRIFNPADIVVMQMCEA